MGGASGVGAVSGREAYGCTSTAPTSHLVPSVSGLGLPRWSVVNGAQSASTQSASGIMSMATLPPPSAWVGHGGSAVVGCARRGAPFTQPERPANTDSAMALEAGISHHIIGVLARVALRRSLAHPSFELFACELTQAEILIGHGVGALRRNRPSLG